MGNEKDRQRSSILVVEDDVTIADLVQLHLRREGYDVAVAHDCASARADLEANERDLVLLDLQLPDGDGLDVLRWLRARDPVVAVVVCTGQEGKVVQARDLGANDFVTKPFRPRELLARIRLVLRSETA
jgi:DNA-binding response OmpR family regulator